MNPEALKKPMFKREGEEINGWIQKLRRIGCGLGSEEGWQWRLLLSGYKTRRQLIETL
jgi:hypothetical protein